MKTKLIFLSVLLLTAALTLTLTASAAIPHLMNFQGKATDKTGVPLNGAHNLTFRIYNSETGGTPKWSETQPNIQISNGIFQVQLGSVTPLSLPFDESYWISIEINTDGEMSLRTQLASVPYAYMAEASKNNIPPGGTTGEALVKNSNNNYDAGWILPTGYSNVIFQWIGKENSAGSNYGLKITPYSGTAFYLRTMAFCNEGGADQYYITLFGDDRNDPKFFKIAGINTVTCWVRMSCSIGGRGASPRARFTIGSLTPLVITGTLNSNTLTWYSGTIDVSSLTNGSNYSIKIEASTTGDDSFYITGFYLTGS